MDLKRRLAEADKKYIWHPFTQMKEWAGEKPLIIEGGEGCHLVDTDGNRYLDGVSSLWVNIHGHRKKEIDEAIRAQIDRVSHSTLLGLSSVPAIQLAERLVEIAQLSFCGRGDPAWSPSDGQAHGPAPADALPSRVFYSDNGSTSVEVALKMAFQYWKHKGVEGKNSFLCLNNAYHGDTLGAVSVGGIDIFHAAFGPLLFRTFRSPSPYCYRCELAVEYPGCGLACLEKMEDILKAHHHEIAALIIEPLVQAAGGMIVFPSGYLKGARDLCAKHHVLFIADEVATGFGRTGRMFACEHESVVPDLICLSKGITGGYLPLAVTVATDEVYNAFLGEFSELKTFFHGHSYTGNPLGCAAALACLDIFEKEGTLEKLAPKISLLEERLSALSRLLHVGNVRNKGLMAGVELVRDKETKAPYAWEEKMGWRVCYLLRDKGILLRPLGNVIVIMPPLAISEEELGGMLDAIGEAIKECCE
ncbi:MAG: adenosylmethionine--8-amino-7-oxononanoate transaminase [Nitrospiraceae bacterium]|nr:adenosylmethionine--8-amino-7-oxononanoate transaminase [Nitrospiraceae bacterium]